MRFVIITVPPTPVADAIEALRRPWNQAVGTKEALRYPPHITLRTGLVCPDDDAPKAAEAFLSHAARCRPAVVRTQGLFFTTYGARGNEQHMAAWSVALSDALLALHQNLLLFTDWKKGPQGPFRPHLSLSYGDLSSQGLETLRHGLGALVPPVADFVWTIDHVALFHETPDGWVEWGRARILS